MRALELTGKLKVVLVAGTLTVVTAGAAFAYWTTTGNGSGSATAGTSSPFQVTTDAATGAPLAPGGPAQTVAFHVKNNNAGVQRLQTVTVTVANADASAWTSVAGCSAADFTVGTPSFTAGDIAPGATVDGTVRVTLDNTGSNQDGCKNATVPLYVNVG